MASRSSASPILAAASLTGRASVPLLLGVAVAVRGRASVFLPGRDRAWADAGAARTAAQGDRLEFPGLAKRLDHRPGQREAFSSPHLARRRLLRRAGALYRRRLCLPLIRGRTRPAVQAGSRLELVKEGLAYVYQNKVVLGAISLDLAAVLLGGRLGAAAGLRPGRAARRRRGLWPAAHGPGAGRDRRGPLSRRPSDPREGRR